MRLFRIFFKFLIALTSLVLIFGQGCLFNGNYDSEIKIEKLTTFNGSGGNSGNGGTYDGKILAHHYLSNFTCEGKAQPQSTLTRNSNGWFYSESSSEKCDIIKNLPVSEIEIEFFNSYSYVLFKEKKYIIVPEIRFDSKICLEKIAGFKYTKGSGSISDPYIICNQSELLEIGKNKDDWDKYFEQMDHIDLTNVKPKDFSPIGSIDMPFTGFYKGNGFAIFNLNINLEQNLYVGLFGRVSKGIIQNVILSTPVVLGKSMVGALVGGIDNLGNSNQQFAEIRNSFVLDGTISGEDRIGGLIGFSSYAVISSSGVESKIQSIKISKDKRQTSIDNEGFVGGLIGEAGLRSLVVSCFSNSEVYNILSHTGGLIGGITNSVMTEGGSKVTGSINSLSRVSLSFSNSKVFGSEAIGGLVGSLLQGIVNKSFSSSNVEVVEESIVGGQSVFVGTMEHSSYIFESYSAGLLNGYLHPQNSGGIAGKFIDESFISNSYYSFPQKSGAGVLVTEDELRIPSTFLGWDFVYTWNIKPNLSFPFFY